MIKVTKEQQSRLNQIIQAGEQGRNTTSLESMQTQYDSIMNWVDSFKGEARDFDRDEIYRNLSIQLEEQLARAFQAIGRGNFKPSADIALVLFHKVYNRNYSGISC